MTNFSAPSSRWSNIGSLATLCILGAMCGLLYAYVFFGIIQQLLIAGAISGALITSIYGFLELMFLPAFQNKTVTAQYFTRVISYFILFISSLLLLSFLHTYYSQFTSGYNFLMIFREDYLPLWPAYVIYALLAAFVFQSVWLFTKVNSKQNAAFASQHSELKSVKAAVLVIDITGDVTVSQDRIIQLYNKLSAIVLQRKKAAVEYYDNGKLKIFYSKKEIHPEELKHLEQALYQQLKSHISDGEKMLRLRLGHAYGNIHLQVCGSQTIFHGDAVEKAELNLKIISAEQHGFHSPVLAFILIV